MTPAEEERIALYVASLHVELWPLPDAERIALVRRLLAPVQTTDVSSPTSIAA